MKKLMIVLCVAVAGVLGWPCRGGEVKNIVKPTARQLEWADCEIGVIIHQDVQVYDPSYTSSESTNLPPACVFNPSALDTDQWIETAAAAGAKYAILVAKHCSGFSLWPTKAHGYSVASSPWRGGKGDVVADFIASCKKYGVKPGIYASTGRNAYLGLNTNGKNLPKKEWDRYLAVVKTQLRELWTNYGELFEIWFDGGNLPPERGGLEIEDMLAELQPNAIVFQGNPARFTSLRWIGNERAHAPEVCWNRTNLGTGSDGVTEALGELYSGCRDGRYWCPGEADMPNRDAGHALQGGWFWRAGDDVYVFPPERLMDGYMTSVGRNCNLLIGMAIDNRGLVPDKDVAAFRHFGQMVKNLYARPAGHASGRGEWIERTSCQRFEVAVPEGMRPSLASFQEDLTEGENVYCFTMSGFDGTSWHSIVSDWNIGHRRLARFRPGNYTRFRLDVWGIKGNPKPIIRDFSVYEERGEVREGRPCDGRNQSEEERSKSEEVGEKVEVRGEGEHSSFVIPNSSATDADMLAGKIAQKHEILRRDTFYGYDRIAFDFEGHEAWIVCPKTAVRADRAWTWTMQWATAFVPRTNVPMMLGEGFRHVTIDTFRHEMDAEGLRVSAAYQRYLVDELGFAPKANLIGMSWGGFFSVRYAAAYPENVAKIYLDAPLLTFTGDNVKSKVWKMERVADWLDHPEMPINKTEAVAAAGIPVLLLYGGVDPVVLPERNAQLFEKRFRAAGGEIRTVCRGSYAHHPHGVEVDETLIRDFFANESVKNLLAVKGPVDGEYVSERVTLDKKNGMTAYYALRFNAKSTADGYWWVDFYDKDGALLPDVNSRLYRSDDFLFHDVMVPASPEAVSAVVKFVLKKGERATIRDIKFRHVTLEEAVDWCGRTYQAGPLIRYVVAPDCWAKLPKSRKALTNGKRRFDVVLLGDSLMNDSYCGLLGVQMQRAFPDVDLRVHVSVRGSTGCWYYREKEHFDEYVAKYKPDLVLIGGISNYLGEKKHTLKEAEEAMVETIERCKEIGAEVVICTPPKSVDFRTDATAKDFDARMTEEGAEGSLTYLYSGYERRAAERTGAQVWDLTEATCTTVSRSGKPLGWFNRDYTHNDDRGKQLIGQLFGEYFRAAYRPIPKK